MIVKTQFTPASMWPYVRFELAVAAVAATAAWVLVDGAGLPQLTLPPASATVLGTALAILLAVRVNTAHQRWWEGSACWAQILGASRNLVRVAVTVTDAKGGDPAEAAVFQRDLARRQSAYVTALRLQLRGQLDAHRSELAAHLDGADAALAVADNPATLLLARQSARIFAAFGEGLLVGLDNFQMEVALATISTQQALAERLAMQPTPRTYDVFSRYLVHLYVVVFPFAVVGTLTGDAWLVVPATLVVAFAFRMIERIGAVVETPFAGTPHDVPLTALSTIVERDLGELVGAGDRPAAPHPVGGYLW